MAHLRRLQPVVESCFSLLDLKPGWDSYGAHAPKLHLIEAALQLITRLMRAEVPAPQVVPTTKGGIQFEWHLGDQELEVEVLSSSRFSVIYENETTGVIYDADLVGEIEPIERQLAKLSSGR